MKLQFLGTYCFFYLITVSESSKCTEKTYTPANIFAGIGSSRPHLRVKRSQHSLQQFICTNVGADLILDVNYEVKPYRQELWISESHIPTLPANSSLSKFTHIKSLLLSHVDLEEVEPGAFDGLVRLLNLDLSNNKLTKISNGIFNNLKTLDALSLNDNKIKEIEANSFKGLDKLTTLYLRGNQLNSFPENFFSELKYLQDLLISENPLTEFLPSEFPNLRSIIAIRTNINFLNIDFTKSPLNQIAFIKGKLERIDFGKLPPTRLIQFEENQISTVQNWDKLSSKHVSLNHNQITSFDISENVEELVLNHNQITTIGNTFLNRTKKLRGLDLAYNKISEISLELLQGLADLEILNLDHNEITKIQEKIFVNSPVLRKLQLSNNKIETIAPNAFVGLENLDHLDISGNNLRKLESPIFSELKRTNVVVGSTEIEWEYVKTLINNSDDFSLQLDEQFWTCHYLDSTNDNVNKIKYITKTNVGNIKCHLKN